MPNRRIVTPHIRDAERMQGFEAGWTEASEAVVKRGHRWKLVGNAVTVDAAEWLGRRLRSPDPIGAEVKASPLKRTGAWPKAAFNVGGGQHVAAISVWPERRDREALHTFLQHPTTPLSVRATTGFLSRLTQSSLNYPDGFVDRLERHLEHMTRAAQASTAVAV
jgi:DNA (cytosine-5)-methyltransferase 1